MRVRHSTYYSVSYPSTLVWYINILVTGITTQPVDSTVIALNDVTLTCSTTYIGGIRYSWHRVGGSVPSKSSGQNSNRLTIPRVVPADEGQYYCIAESFGHCAKSNEAAVMVDGEKIALSCINVWGI